MHRLTDDTEGLSEKAVRLDGPEFDAGIVGTYEAADGEYCLVYGYNRLCEALARSWDVDLEEARDTWTTTRCVRFRTWATTVRSSCTKRSR